MKKRNDPRHIARQIAVQVLFEWSFHHDTNLPTRLSEIREEFDFDENENMIDFNNASFDEELLENVLRGVEEHKEEIDEIITECAPEWPLDQIARVDVAILRIAIFEVLYYDPTPTKVAIDEAVELGKEYGGDNTSRFVNGVMGTVVKNYLEKDDTMDEESD